MYLTTEDIVTELRCRAVALRLRHDKVADNLAEIMEYSASRHEEHMQTIDRLRAHGYTGS